MTCAIRIACVIVHMHSIRMLASSATLVLRSKTACGNQPHQRTMPQGLARWSEVGARFE
jgi:hypothetical protein